MLTESGKGASRANGTHETHESIRQTPSNEKRYWTVVGLTILAASTIVFSLLWLLAPQPVLQTPQPEAPLVRTASLDVKSGSVIVNGQGLVRPRAEVTLTAQVSGEIIYTSPSMVSGGVFDIGQELVRIDPRPYRAALTQTEAQKRALEANLTYLDKQLTRNTQLSVQGAASQQRADETLSQRDQVRAQIAGLAAAIQSRNIELERTVITAPFAGRVVSEKVDIGSVVGPGQEVGRIFALDTAEVVVPLTDSEAALIPGIWRLDQSEREKQQAWATTTHRGKKYRWTGYVDRVEAGLDAQTRTVDVVVRIPHPDYPGEPSEPNGVADTFEPPPLLMGTYVNVEIEGTYLTNYAIVPRAAVRSGNTLWVMSPENRLSISSIKVIQRSGEYATIQASGLVANSQIIVTDLNVVSDGMLVRVSAQNNGFP